MREKISGYYEKQIMTETGYRDRKFFQFVSEVVNIKGDEKTVGKNADEDNDKFNSFFVSKGANLAKKLPITKLTHRAKQINS